MLWNLNLSLESNLLKAAILTVVLLMLANHSQHYALILSNAAPVDFAGTFPFVSSYITANIIYLFWFLIFLQAQAVSVYLTLTATVLLSTHPVFHLKGYASAIRKSLAKNSSEL